MTRKITPRKLTLIDETVRRVETRPLQYQRNLLKPSLLGSPGTDFGTAIVPRTTIPAATRTVQDGSDLFKPGVGTAYLFKVTAAGHILPWQDGNGNPIWNTIYNFSTQSFPANSTPLEMQSSSSSSQDVFELQNGDPFELQASLGPTDYIGPDTKVLLAIMDRAGKLCIRPGEGDTVEGSVKLAKRSGTPLPKLSGSTPGSGTVTVWEFTNGTIAATAEMVTAYNWTDYDVPVGELIVIRKEVASGRWLVDLDGQHTIEGFSVGADGSETLFPYDKLIVFGDRDESVAVGNIIDVTISKAANDLKVRIDAVGDLFKVVDNDSPQGSINVALGETITLTTVIDEAGLAATFSEWRASGNDIKIAFGQLFEVEDDQVSPNKEVMFPIEDLKIKTSNPSNQVTVTKAANVITVDIDLQDCKVKVRTTDVCGYLEDQFLDWIIDADGDRFNSTEDPVIEFQTEGAAAAEQLRAFINSSDIPGYTVSTELHLGLDSSTNLKWLAPGGSDGRVKVRTSDVLDFLEKQFTNWIVDADGDRFTSSEDPVIEVQTEGAATAEQLRLFINASDISGYVASTELHLGLDTGTNLKWLAPGGSDGRVKVRTSDVLGFMEDQFVDWIIDADGDRFTSAEDPVIEFQTEGAVGSEQLRAFLNSSDITDYSATGELHLSLDGNVLKWSNKGHVRVRATDALGYLETQFVNWIDPARFTVAEDPLIEFQTEGAAGSEQLRAFINSSIIPGYHATNEVHLALDGGNLKWIAPGGNDGKVKVRAADALDYLEQQFTDWIIDADPDRFNSTEDPVIEVQSEGGGADFDLRLFINASDISGYVASTELHLGLDTGTSLKWLAPGGSDGRVKVRTSDVLGFLETQFVDWITDGDADRFDALADPLIEFQTEGGPGSEQLRGFINSSDITGYQPSGKFHLSLDNDDLEWLTAPDGRVKVRTTDALGFLEDQLIQWITDVDGDRFKSLSDPLVEFQTEGAAGLEKIRGFINSSDIVGYSSSGVFHLSLDNDDLEWQAAPNGRVKVRSTDALGFLETQFVDWITDANPDRFKPAEDLLVELQTDPTTPGSEKLRGFINSSDISGYTDLGELHLTLDSNSLKWKAPSAGSSFTVVCDQGTPQVISGGDTLTIEGSNLVAAPLQADRGIVSSAVSVDTVELSVDETVHQKTVLAGTGTNTFTVLVGAGTRNVLHLRSDKSTTVTEPAGTKGWVQINGDSSGEVEFILHQEATSYSFSIDAESGAAEVVASGNTVFFEGSGGSAQGSPADRGIATAVSAVDTIELSVDETVMQKLSLGGTGATGITPVLIKNGTRNTLNIISNTSSTVEALGAKGHIEVKGDVGGSVELILHEQKTLPIGAMIPGYKAPLLSGGKRYIDRNGDFDTDWALMDGSSNASPGSGIDMRDYFVRGKGNLSAANNTAAGRTIGTVDCDEVTVGVNDHVDHVHFSVPDQCHDDPGSASPVHFDFSSASLIKTGIQKDDTGGALTLTHTVVNINGQVPGESNKIEMTPPHKKLHWFEKVA